MNTQELSQELLYAKAVEDKSLIKCKRIEEITVSTFSKTNLTEHIKRKQDNVNIT